MPYRQSAGKRNDVKVALNLSHEEVREAILDFLEEKELLPEGVQREAVEITVNGKWSNNKWRNACNISFMQRVLTLSDS